MMRNIALSLLVPGVTATASTARTGKAASQYDPAAERTDPDGCGVSHDPVRY